MSENLIKQFNDFCKEDAKCPFPNSKKSIIDYCEKHCNAYKFLLFLKKNKYKIRKE
jgi:hypothetical protein